MVYVSLSANLSLRRQCSKVTVLTTQDWHCHNYDMCHTTNHLRQYKYNTLPCILTSQRIRFHKEKTITTTANHMLYHTRQKMNANQ